MKTDHWMHLTALVGATVIFAAAPVSAQPVLGTAQNFGVLGGSAVDNTGDTVVTGDLGVSPGSAVTGFPPGMVSGTIHEADAVALQAQNDVTTAYDFLASQPVTSDLTSINLGSLTLLPGVYFFSSSAQLTGTLTLDAQGDPDAVFIFRIGSTLTTASNSSVVLINGAQNCNVFWQVGSSATLGTGTTFVGNILALTSISLTTGASVSGRVLARNGAVTLDTNAVAVANCFVGDTPPPTLSKAFNPATIDAGDTSTLTITLHNADDADATLTADLVDTLPAGVEIAAVPNAATDCGGTLVANAGESTVTLEAGNAIPDGGTCTVTVDVTAAAGGVYLNTIPAGALETSNGSNPAAAVATLSVNSTITLAKAFSPATISGAQDSTLTITLGNANVGLATLEEDLVDTLPAGMVIAATPNATTDCGGATLVANAGESTVTLQAGATIPNGTCTVMVDVTAPAGASYLNTLAIGDLETDLGSNTVPASAALVVDDLSPAPTISKVFTPGTIATGGVSTLIITLINPSTNIATLSAAFTDTLPAGVEVAATPNESTNCPGGVFAPVPVSGDTAVTLSVGAIPAGDGITAGSCTVRVDVTAADGGEYLNTIPAGALQTDEGSNASPANAILAVIDAAATPPTLSKAFSPFLLQSVGASSTLTITLCNPNANPADLIAPLTDTLPAGVVIAAAPNASTTCPGDGAVVASAGGTTVILPATRSIQGDDCCTVSVDVTATALGTFVNTIPAGALQTTNGDNPLPAEATLTVEPFPAPALSVWAMMLAVALLSLIAFGAMRRRAI